MTGRCSAKNSSISMRNYSRATSEKLDTETRSTISAMEAGAWSQGFLPGQSLRPACVRHPQSRPEPVCVRRNAVVHALASAPYPRPVQCSGRKSRTRCDRRPGRPAETDLASACTRAIAIPRPQCPRNDIPPDLRNRSMTWFVVGRMLAKYPPGFNAARTCDR